MSILWLVGIGSLAVGICIGIVSAGRFNVNPSKIRELETRLENALQGHDKYREHVSDHFNTTADLVQQMTDSYKDVYQHLASGAQELCSGEVANKLLPAGTQNVFTEPDSKLPGSFQPPKDYAAKQNPNQPGTLSENFGLENAKASNDNLSL